MPFAPEAFINGFWDEVHHCWFFNPFYALTQIAESPTYIATAACSLRLTPSNGQQPDLALVKIFARSASISTIQRVQLTWFCSLKSWVKQWSSIKMPWTKMVIVILRVWGCFWIEVAWGLGRLSWGGLHVDSGDERSVNTVNHEDFEGSSSFISCN